MHTGAGGAARQKQGMYGGDAPQAYQIGMRRVEENAEHRAVSERAHTHGHGLGRPCVQ